MNALVILVVIAIAMAGYYLYQQKVKKAALPGHVPAIVSLESAPAPG